MKNSLEILAIGVVIIGLAFTGMQCDHGRREDERRTYRVCQEACGTRGVAVVRPQSPYDQCVCR